MFALFVDLSTMKKKGTQKPASNQEQDGKMSPKISFALSAAQVRATSLDNNSIEPLIQ